MIFVQVDHSAWSQPPVDLVPALLAAGGPLLQLPTTQAVWRNFPNLSQQEVVTMQNGDPVHCTYGKVSPWKQSIVAVRICRPNGNDDNPSLKN